MPGIYHAMSAAMSIKAVRQPSVQGSGAPPLPCGMRALKRATGGPLKCLRHFSSCRSFLRLLGRAFPWFCMAPRNGLAISILSHSVLGGKESDDNASSVIWSHVTYHMCWVGKNADCKVNRLMHKTNRPCKPPTVLVNRQPSQTIHQPQRPARECWAGRTSEPANTSFMSMS